MSTNDVAAAMAVGHAILILEEDSTCCSDDASDFSSVFGSLLSDEQSLPVIHEGEEEDDAERELKDGKELLVEEWLSDEILASRSADETPEAIKLAILEELKRQTPSSNDDNEPADDDSPAVKRVSFTEETKASIRQPTDCESTVQSTDSSSPEDYSDDGYDEDSDEDYEEFPVASQVKPPLRPPSMIKSLFGRTSSYASSDSSWTSQESPFFGYDPPPKPDFVDHVDLFLDKVVGAVLMDDRSFGSSKSSSSLSEDNRLFHPDDSDRSFDYGSQTSDVCLFDSASEVYSESECSLPGNPTIITVVEKLLGDEPIPKIRAVPSAVVVPNDFLDTEVSYVQGEDQQEEEQYCSDEVDESNELVQEYVNVLNDQQEAQDCEDVVD